MIDNNNTLIWEYYLYNLSHHLNTDTHQIRKIKIKHAYQVALKVLAIHKHMHNMFQTLPESHD
jgi:hypothetical protein